jgi:hypothetical protein
VNWDSLSVRLNLGGPDGDTAGGGCLPFGTMRLNSMPSVLWGGDKTSVSDVPINPLSLFPISSSFFFFLLRSSL